MGHHGRRQGARGVDIPWAQHGWGGGPPWGDWGGHGRRGPGGRGPSGPPPWLAGLFGLDQPERRRGPRVRRGDVRSAILDVLRAAAEADEAVNGYQVIQQIAERSEGAWRPSPGSVYPTIQQLQDEGLVAEDQDRGRRTLRLTDEGATYVAERADELASVWVPFERESARERTREGGRDGIDGKELKSEIGQVMGAVWQIVSQGSEQQRRAAVEVLVETRRRLYGVLADGHDLGRDAAPDEEDEA